MQGNVTHADNYFGVQFTHPECDIDHHDGEASNTDYMSEYLSSEVWSITRLTTQKW
jgi:hypothetical protein